MHTTYLRSSRLVATKYQLNSEYLFNNRQRQLTNFYKSPPQIRHWWLMYFYVFILFYVFKKKNVYYISQRDINNYSPGVPTCPSEIILEPLCVHTGTTYSSRRTSTTLASCHFAILLIYIPIVVVCDRNWF